jgi:hypothetical protein
VKPRTVKLADLKAGTILFRIAEATLRFKLEYLAVLDGQRVRIVK